MVRVTQRIKVLRVPVPSTFIVQKIWINSDRQ
jgi:hypothetical protein